MRWIRDDTELLLHLLTQTPYKEQGERFQKQRVIVLKETLREFCERTGHYPAAISALERGALKPPTGEVLRKLEEDYKFGEGGGSNDTRPRPDVS